MVEEDGGPRLAPMERDHWDAVAEIYAQGIADGDATFQEEVPAWEEWDGTHHPHSRLVALWGEEGAEGAVVGWAALSPISRREVYRGVAEVSVYVHHLHRGRGVGRLLLDGLIAASEAAGVWTLQAGVFPENRGSVALHLRAGFRVVGDRERIGRLKGVWRDVLLLERRSRVVGN